MLDVALLNDIIFGILINRNYELDHRRTRLISSCPISVNTHTISWVNIGLLKCIHQPLLNCAVNSELAGQGLEYKTVGRTLLPI